MLKALGPGLRLLGALGFLTAVKPERAECIGPTLALAVASGGSCFADNGVILPRCAHQPGRGVTGAFCAAVGEGRVKLGRPLAK